MSGVNQSSGVLCRLEMPAWNGPAGSRPLREPAGAAGMGGVGLVCILGISHCPLENDLYFTHSVSPAVSGCVLSEDIPGCQVFVIKIWDVMVSAWKG